MNLKIYFRFGCVCVSCVTRVILVESCNLMLLYFRSDCRMLRRYLERGRGALDMHIGTGGRRTVAGATSERGRYRLHRVYSRRSFATKSRYRLEQV